MKRLIIIGLLAFLPVLGWGAVASAQSFKSGTDVMVAANQVIDQTIIAAGHNIDIAGTVNGDVICVGQTVSISGTVNGDVICAGQIVRISGAIHGSLRLAGQNVTIDGTVDRNASVAGQNVSFDASSKMGIDLNLLGEVATLDGSVGRDLAIAGSDVTLNGTIGRNAQARITSLILGNGTVIHGNLSYVSGSQANEAGGAQIDGSVNHTWVVERHERAHAASAFLGSFFFTAYMFIGFVLFSVLLVLVLPRVFHDASDAVVRHPWQTLGQGVVTGAVVPIAIVVLFLTGFGIPFALFIILVWILVCGLSLPLAAYLVGRLIMSRSTNHVIVIMAVGAAVLGVACLLPIIGFFVVLVAMWYGLGMIVSQLARLPKPEYNLPHSHGTATSK